MYTGITNNLERRILEHYSHRGQDTTFAGRYNVYYLLYFECHKYVLNAIAREKEIKGWRRQKKMQLINSFNPSLSFLNEEIFGKWPPVEMSNRVPPNN